jgi:membrane fusion protein, multidrug efflux system
MIKKNDRKKLVTKACFVLLIIPVISLVSGCSGKKPQKEMPPRPVNTGVAIQKDVPIYIESFGNMYSPNDVNIISQVTGQIKEAGFKDGDIVSRGDILFTIDPDPYKADVDKAEAALAQDTANLKLAKDTLDRNKKLFDKELISRQDLDSYETNVASLEAKTALDKANIELSRINLGYCFIHSPIDGLTGRRLVDPGNVVTENDGPTLVNIKTIDPLYTDFTVPEAELDRIREAMREGALKVELSVVGNNDYSYSGELHFLDNAVDNSTGTVLLRSIVPNKDKALWAGQFVRVRLILYTQKDAILVPYEAVQLGRDGLYLFAVTPDNKAELRTAKAGNRENSHIIIEEGVRAGEKVVTAGHLGLSPGVAVIDVTQQKTEQGEKPSPEKKDAKHNKSKGK